MTMQDESGFASQWRVGLATELCQFYTPRDAIRMIVLGGSPTKGLSDSYSDLDIVVYWDAVDVDWLEQIPLRQIECVRSDFRRLGKSDIYLESYHLDTLKVDFGHVTMDLWNELVDDVLIRHQTTPSIQKTLGGFLASLPLHGAAEAEAWKGRVAEYPEALARAMVTENLGFFVQGCLLHQGYERGDLLFYHDGLCMMLKRLLGILAGVNGVYLSTEEPRWIEYELSRMSLQPPDAWQRMKAVLTSEATEAVGRLDELIVDVLSLVGLHMPEIDLTDVRRRYAQRVEVCHARPVLRRR